MSDQLRGARILVTGASGFIGRPLTQALVRSGAEVHGLSRSSRRDDGAGVRWWTCDLTDPSAVQACFGRLRPDHVVHLSSLADGRGDRGLVMAAFRSETVSTLNVLDAAAEVGTRRVILPASLEEPESGEAPTSPYAAAKAASHLYARLYRRLYGVPVVMVRIFMAYGPGQPEWKLIPATALTMLRGQTARIESPGRLLDWIYISDVVAGFLAVLRAPDIDEEPIDIGSGQLTSIREIVAELHRLTGCGLTPDDRGMQARGNAHARSADLDRTARLVGWTPSVSLAEGLQRTVAALQQDMVT